MALTVRQDLSNEARAGMAVAGQYAARTGSTLITLKHVLLALLDPPPASLQPILSALRVDPSPIVAGLRNDLPPAEAETAPTGLDAPTTLAIKRAAREAHALGSPDIDTRHLLLGLLSAVESQELRKLREAGLTEGALRGQLLAEVQPAAPRLPRVSAVVEPSTLFLALLGLLAGSGADLILAPNAWNLRVLTGLFVVSGWVVALCVHEFGHALAGYLGGDTTVAERGLLTLDPRRYGSPLFSVVLPAATFVLGGFPLPGGSARIDRSRLRSKGWGCLVSLAGPLGTLLCLLLAALPFYLGLDQRLAPHAVAFWSALAALAELLALALVLNLLPVPPLDGYRLLASWLPRDFQALGYSLSLVPLILLFVLLNQPNIVSHDFWRVSDALIAALHLPVQYAGVALHLLLHG